MEHAAAPPAPASAAPEQHTLDGAVDHPQPPAEPDHPTHVTREQAAPQGPAGSSNPPSAIDARFADANAARMRGHVSERTRKGQAKRESY